MENARTAAVSHTSSATRARVVPSATESSSIQDTPHVGSQPEIYRTVRQDDGVHVGSVYRALLLDEQPSDGVPTLVIGRRGRLAHPFLGETTLLAGDVRLLVDVRQAPRESSARSVHGARLTVINVLGARERLPIHPETWQPWDS